MNWDRYKDAFQNNLITIAHQSRDGHSSSRGLKTLGGRVPTSSGKPGNWVLLGKSLEKNQGKSGNPVVCIFAGSGPGTWVSDAGAYETRSRPVASVTICSTKAHLHLGDGLSVYLRVRDTLFIYSVRRHCFNRVDLTKANPHNRMRSGHHTQNTNHSHCVGAMGWSKWRNHFEKVELVPK